MKYDDDIYSGEEDSDLWDDELELNLDDPQTGKKESSQSSYSEESTYSPYSGGYDDPQDDYHDHYGIENGDGDPDHDYYSDPTPAPDPVRPRRENPTEGKEADAENDDDDYDQDYYSETESAPKPRSQKTPKLDPEDPDYWISEEDSPLSGIMTGPGKKWMWKLAAILALIVGLAFAWIWFLRPYTDSAVQYGYIKNMERRGTLIKTFEGTMIPYKELGDPDPFYFKEVPFSVKGDSLAALMKRMMLGCIPVRVEYELYHAPLPWKGEQKMVIVKVDTADPRKILPPEYRR